MEAQEKESYVKGLFNRIARRYDFMNNVMTFGLHRRWKRQSLLTVNRLRPGGRALDLCAGTGDYAFIARDLAGPMGEVVAVDFSEEMIGIARRRSEQKGLRNIRFLTGDILLLPEELEGRFDVVTIGFSLRNLVNIQGAFGAMYSSLKPGGGAVALELSIPKGCLIRESFLFYIRRIVPLLARILVNAGKEYGWLHQSLVTLPTLAELCDIMRGVGFVNIKELRFALGTVTALVGYKEPF